MQIEFNTNAKKGCSERNRWKVKLINVTKKMYRFKYSTRKVGRYH